MNARTVSLPDLVTEKRRNTALSLSEGFAGARREGSLAATAVNWAPRPGQGAPLVGQKDAGKELDLVLPIYYRTRQQALGMQKAGRRMPQQMNTELRGLEKAVVRELRPLHPLFFQRFDDMQLDRLLRSMPFLRLSSGRWLFGGENLTAPWPEEEGEKAFLLLSGHMALYPDPAGVGDRTDIYKGALFGEKHFMLGDEGLRDLIAGAAHCEEPCIVGLITTASLDAAYADRAFGNARIAQTWRTVSAMSRICKPDDEGKGASDESSNAVIHALRDMSKVATSVHLQVGAELLCSEPLEESVLLVCKGALEVKGDVVLTERMEIFPANGRKGTPTTRKPNTKTWPDQELFRLNEQACWGHEHIMLQNIFMRTLEDAASQMAYTLQLTNIRIVAAAQKGGSSAVSIWKCSKPRFLEFVRHTGREKPFLQACRVSALEKQTLIKEMIKRLVTKWEIEKEADLMRRGLLNPSKPMDALHDW